MEKGKLPITEKIILESDESLWNLFINGLIEEVKTSGVIEKEPNVRVRVKLTITDIASPKNLWWRKNIQLTTSLKQEFAEGLKRSLGFMYEYLFKTTWLFYGYIDGEEKIPITIIHVQSLDLSVYTQKLKDEPIKMFFPPHPEMN